MGRNETAPRGQEAANYRDCDRERRIGYHPKGPSRKTEVTSIGLNDGHRAVSESLPQL
jgi:hypothetical protein